MYRHRYVDVTSNIAEIQKHIHAKLQSIQKQMQMVEPLHSVLCWCLFVYVWKYKQSHLPVISFFRKTKVYRFVMKLTSSFTLRRKV